MVIYKVKVRTGSMLGASTSKAVYVQLTGTKGSSAKTLLSGLILQGTEVVTDVVCPSTLGQLLTLTFYVENRIPGDIITDEWFCEKGTVTTPEGEKQRFPVYHWLTVNKPRVFRDAAAHLIFQDDIPELLMHRAFELDLRRAAFSWALYTAAPCLPHIVAADSAYGLPAEVRFSFSKEAEFTYTIAAAMIALGITNLVQKPWASFDDIGALFTLRKTKMYQYVEAHWREDEFFGYQFLNGHNPMMIRACLALPDNFPVTEDMVQASFQKGSSLSEELKKGNIFLVDYNRLDGLAAAVVNKKQQYLASPLVLLHKTPENKLMPIAIQLKQQPGDANPIFLPSDSQYDWLLAKTFVRSAEFAEHELKYHLLHTHLVCEAFAMATLRHFPMVHPLFKVLFLHFRYTLQINILARKTLLMDFFPNNTAVGGPGMVAYLEKAMASLTYSSLCVPEEIAARGMDQIPNYHYRDDALQLWDIIHRYVQGVVTFYYTSDSDVTRDSELQNWIHDIFTHCFHANSGSGFPRSLCSVPDLVKFVAMVIFTSSAQHAAVNNGQFDYAGYMPNAPPSMQLPPPTTKGQSSEATLLLTLPDQNVTAHDMAILYLLSKPAMDFVVLGGKVLDQYEEATPREKAKEFQDDLLSLTEKIKLRNKSLDLPYTYLVPEQIENSVAI